MFLEALNNAPAESETKAPDVENINGVDMMWDGSKWTTIDEPVDTTPSGVPISEAIAKALEQCKTGAQCGRFVNNVYENATGEKLGINDTLASKL